MKKNIIMLLAAALLVVAGCKKDDNKDNNANGEKMTFTSNLGGGAKTAITGKDMIWTDGDQIIINGETFDSEIFDEGRLAKFTGNVVEPVYQAFYPIGIYKGENSYVLPATQTYSGNTLSGVNPMYARSTSTSLDFHNICALVKLDLTGTDIVTRIVAAADQPLSGAFSIAGDETNGYYAQLTSKDGAATVTLDCSNSVVQLNETTPTTFYMALPQGDFTNLTFTVENDKGMTAIAKQLALCPLQAGHLSNEVAQVVYNALPGVFSVSATKKVHFSKGNLYWDGSAFRFEANQWDYRHYSGKKDDKAVIDGMSQTTPSGTVGSFFWSKTASVAYAGSYNDSGTSNEDVFFTNGTQTTANPNFQVSGEAAGTWRTLSYDEWGYLLNTRANATSLRRWKELDGVTHKGLVILPDGTENPSEVLDGITKTSDLATHGAVFLPAAGKRSNSSVFYVGGSGNYWASNTGYKLDPFGELMFRDFVCDMYFSEYDVRTHTDGGRDDGYAVRLVL